MEGEEGREGGRGREKILIIRRKEKRERRAGYKDMNEEREKLLTTIILVELGD